MESAPQDSHPEVVADRYVIHRELGRGGTAIVYLADDTTNGSSVALKILRPDVSAVLGRERFLREVRLSSTLQHAGILTLLDSGTVDGNPFYVMPFVEGGSLHDLLQREGPLSFDRTLKILAEIADAIDYAHSQGIAHRDIKPDNILFVGDRAVVTDFGIARAFSEAASERLTESGIAIGTPAYMSPEQAGSERQIDGRTDVYSLACVTFEMLTGERPFTGLSAKSVLAKHMYERPPALSVVRPTVTYAMEAAINKALAKTPADRFETAGAFVRALSAGVANKSLAPNQRRRFAVAAAALGIVLVASALAVKRTANGSKGSAFVAENSRRIAVLYFDDLSRDRSLGHIAAGLTEDLIDQLSQVAALHVISPAGVRPYRDSSVSVEALRNRLNVGTLIDGSVTRLGSVIRVSVRLADATTGQQVHSRTFERPSWELLKLQDSLTDDVAYSLRERLGRHIRLRDQQQSANSVEAWEIVQRGEELSRQATSFTLASDSAVTLSRHADSLFAEAERRDRKWIVPLLDRAHNAFLLAFLEPASRGSEETVLRAGIRQATAYAEQALARQPGNAEALAFRADARLRSVMFGGAGSEDSLLRLSEIDLRRAASTRPDLARAWVTLGDVYSQQGRFSEAADAYRTAYDSDAFLTDIRAVVNMLFFSMVNAERFDEAHRWCRYSRTKYPGDPRFAECELTLLGRTGKGAADLASARRWLMHIERVDSTGMLGETWAFRRMMVAAVMARSGMRDSARAVLATTRAELGSRAAAPPLEAYVRLLLGERAEALRLLTETVKANPRARKQLPQIPLYRTLRGDPRFQALVEPAS